MIRLLRPPNQAGSALISTMLVITVLTIIVVAFLQSMTVERQTARSYLNRYKAELAAESGANEATNLLLASDQDCLVNAYAEDTSTYKDAPYTAPYLTLLKLAPDANSVAETRYLCSSVDSTSSGISWRKPSDATGAETTDINAATSSFPEGFIGLENLDGSRRVIPVPWRELLADLSKPKNEDPQSSSYNPVVGRYAYWVDDESAKVNLTTAGSADSKNEHHHEAGRNPSEVAIHPILATDPTAAGPDVATFITKRGLPPFKDASPPLPPSSFRHISTGLAADALWRNQRAFVTSTGEADERGPIGGVPNLPGIRKINLNDFVAKAHDYQSADGQKEIAKDVVALGDYINKLLPDFGKRAANSLSSATTVTAPDAQRRYCIQIAANIQDYIDADSQPTVIKQNLGWQEPPDPTETGAGAPAQPPLAFGKENVPSITEYVSYFYNDGGQLRIDHTFETLNIYTKDITLDPSKWGTVRIFLAERPVIYPLSTGTPPTLKDPLVLTIPANIVIPAGRYSLFTTLPVGSSYRSQWIAVDTSTEKWTPLNWITLARVESTFSYGGTGLRMQADGTATAADADTEIVVANDYGYLDIQPRVAQQGAGATGVSNLTSGATAVIASQPFGNDGTSSGNNQYRKYPTDSGDPRSQTDIYPTYSESVGPISILAWRRNSPNNNSNGNTVLGGDSKGATFGFMPSNSGDSSTYVPEPLFAENITTQLRATAVIRDADMATIGELGFIYDPALPGAPDSSGTWKRGGFRTLSIGTRYGEVADAGSGGTISDPLRLPQTVPHPETAGPNLTSERAYRLMDLFDVSNDRNGRILLNSALRDPRNIPLRSVFYNLKTQGNTAADIAQNTQEKTYNEYAGPKDPKITADTEINVDNVISALVAEAPPSKTGPFLSLGQLGDLDIFNTGTTLYGASLTPNATNTSFYDRGREEVLRNTFQRLTLKGSVYTVYVVAQSGDTVKSTFVPRSTVRLARTIKLQRSYPADSLATITPTALQTNNTPTPIPSATTVMPIANEFY